MALALYLSHPEVAIDPAVPVTLWPLSAEGQARAARLASRLAWPTHAVVFSSTERKAMDLAETILARGSARLVADPTFGENDRSATGFLPPDLFETTADRFFAAPGESIEGWEPAAEAQRRIVAAVSIALASLPEGAVAIFCGHGGVGTLLKCHLAGRPISRNEDQSRKAASGGGNGFVFATGPARLLTDWTPFEAIPADILAAMAPYDQRLGVQSSSPNTESASVSPV